MALTQPASASAEYDRRQQAVLYGHASPELLHDVSGLTSVVKALISSGRFEVEESHTEGGVVRFLPVERNRIGITQGPNDTVEIVILDQEGTEQQPREVRKVLLLGRDEEGRVQVVLGGQVAHVDTLTPEEMPNSDVSEGITRGHLRAYLERFTTGEFPSLPAELAQAVGELLGRDTLRLVEETDQREAVARNDALMDRLSRWRTAFFASVVALFSLAGVHFEKPLRNGLDDFGDTVEELVEDAEDEIEDGKKSIKKAWKEWTKDDKKPPKKKKKK